MARLGKEKAEKNWRRKREKKLGKKKVRVSMKLIHSHGMWYRRKRRRVVGEGSREYD